MLFPFRRGAPRRAPRRAASGGIAIDPRPVLLTAESTPVKRAPNGSTGKPGVRWWGARELTEPESARYAAGQRDRVVERGLREDLRGLLERFDRAGLLFRIGAA